MILEELDQEIDRYTGWWRKAVGQHKDRLWVALKELIEEREARDRAGNGKRRTT